MSQILVHLAMLAINGTHEIKRSTEDSRGASFM